MDTVLEVLGIRTREHAAVGAVDSLQQWAAVQQSHLTDATVQSASAAIVSPMTDSAFGDEIEEGVEATDYIETSDDVVPS